MGKDEDTIRREAAAMQQGVFQGEVLVNLDHLKNSDEKQWDAIEANRKRTEVNLEKILPRDSCSICCRISWIQRSNNETDS